MKTLIIYSSKKGCVTKIVNKIENKVKCDSVNIFQDKVPSLKIYDRIIIGSSIYIGSINKKIKALIKNNLKLLQSKKIALFICGLAQGEELEKEFSSNFPLELRNVSISNGLFTGEAIHSKLNFFQSFVIKRINKTDKDICKLDFKQVDEFLSKLK